MDESRLLDLKRLDGVINNPLKSRWAREQAFKSKQLIIQQSQDNGLQRLRERLIRASRVHDEQEIFKIERQIKAYRHEKWEEYLPD